MGENKAANKYIIVATTAIAGPGVVSKRMARTSPATAEKSPNTAARVTTCFNLLVSKRAVEAGVISMATALSPSPL